jgi:ATP-dependent DNA helicase RecG
MSLQSPLAEGLRKQLGPKTAEALAKSLNLETVEDLLRHYPRRYMVLGELTPFSALPVGEAATVLVEVVKVERTKPHYLPNRRRPVSMVDVYVDDGEQTVPVRFFTDRGPHMALQTGQQVLMSGVVKLFRNKPQLSHPAIEWVESDDDAQDKLERPNPIYPATAALASRQIRKTVETVLGPIGDLEPFDPLPAELRRRLSLPSLREAFEAIHRPVEESDWRRARYRFRYEEAFVLQTALALRRRGQDAAEATARPTLADGLLAAFDERLPFRLTDGQVEVGAEVAADLARPHPMHRLLQGEVGSGKTVVALRAMLTVADSGGQAALLAPTEVLAVQHYRGITAMLGDLAERGRLGGDDRGTRVVLLTGSMSTAVRRAGMLATASGEALIVVGTHALLGEKTTFADLGLVVVDEQHRFGVEQREALRAKGSSPHALVLTATPIPRTVAMTVFGDLETSTLRELPVGRSPIATHVVPYREKAGWYERTWTRVREEVAAGHQVYVVCPRIGGAASADDATADDATADDATADDATADDATGDGAPLRPSRAVLEVLDELRATPDLAGLTIETLHGRLPVDAREDTMRRFAAGSLDVLVATTVIEVGVDVANATTMVVLDADRFGVSQLHQLRGRVGRGQAAGLCLLMTELEVGTPGRERLAAVAATTDGFELARVDLEQRREGDVLGARQSGGTSLRLLRVLRDEKIIEAARDEAVALVAQDGDLGRHPALAARLATEVADRGEFLERG